MIIIIIMMEEAKEARLGSEARGPRSSGTGQGLSIYLSIYISIYKHMYIYIYANSCCPLAVRKSYVS